MKSGWKFHKHLSNFLFLGVQDDSVVLLLEPLHGVFLRETVLESDHATLASSLGDVVTC